MESLGPTPIPVKTAYDKSKGLQVDEVKPALVHGSMENPKCPSAWARLLRGKLHLAGESCEPLHLPLGIWNRDAARAGELGKDID